MIISPSIFIRQFYRMVWVLIIPIPTGWCPAILRQMPTEAPEAPEAPPLHHPPPPFFGPPPTLLHQLPTSSFLLSAEIQHANASPLWVPHAKILNSELRYGDYFLINRRGGKVLGEDSTFVGLLLQAVRTIEEVMRQSHRAYGVLMR